jgi:hypothetical protein
MKKIIMLLLVLICAFSCTVAPIIYTPDPTPNDSEVLGIWSRGVYSWDFTNDGNFTYYRNDTSEVMNSGWYNIDTENKSIYVEDSDNGESQLYIYEILFDFPTFGDVTLQWHPEGAPMGLVDWIKE